MINALVLGLLIQLSPAGRHSDLTIESRVFTSAGKTVQDTTTGDSAIVRNIFISGNKKTKRFIILRELNFIPGETIPLISVDELLRKSRNQLLNTSLFNSAELSVKRDSLAYIDIYIHVAERWYLWPVPIFELADRNFNQWYLNRDFRRTNYGINLTQFNFLGRNQTLNLLFQLGYTQQYAIIYNIPYINNSNTLGLTFNAGYALNHEVPYTTVNDSLQFLRLDDKYAMQRFNTSVSLNFRPRLYNVYKISVNYGYIDIAPEVVADAYNPDFLLDRRIRQEALGLKLSHINDHRDSRSYPLNGSYVKSEIWGLGLGLSKNVNIAGAYLQLGKYARIAKKTYLAGGLRSKISLPQRQPYYNNKALGYEDYVRGYEYYVIDGSSYLLLKGALKYNFFPLRYFNLKFVPFQQFNKVPLSAFAGLFLDAAYVYNKYPLPGNTLPNSLLAGGGIALDITSYYDKTARIEFSYNKLRQFGVFLHFVLAI
jgi:outer membrane protein assembly factor BamA